MTAVLTNIKSLQQVRTPMIQVSQTKWRGEFNSRYVREDIQFGMQTLVSPGNVFKIETPMMCRIIKWYEVITNSKILDESCKVLPSSWKNDPQKWNLNSPNAFYKFYRDF